MLGTTLAVYYKITLDGLQANDGTVLFNPAKFLSAKAGLLLNSGNAKLLRQDYDGAIADFDRALELDPKNALAYANRAVIKGMKGDLDGGIADYSRAIELDPKASYQNYHNRGFSKSMKGDLDGAISDYNRAIELSPNIPTDYHNRGLAYCKKRDYDRAWADVKKCRELGGKVDTEFLAELSKASGRTE